MRGDYPSLPEAADFGLATDAFFAAAFFGPVGFALAPALSIAPSVPVCGEIQLKLPFLDVN